MIKRADTLLLIWKLTSELTLTICNIYAPNFNTDDPVFFKNVSEQMLSFKCDEIILGGDFNLVLDILKNKKGGKQTTHCFYCYRNTKHFPAEVASNTPLIITP